jgi:hypothetical protein
LQVAIDRAAIHGRRWGLARGESAAHDQVLNFRSIERAEVHADASSINSSATLEALMTIHFFAARFNPCRRFGDVSLRARQFDTTSVDHAVSHFLDFALDDVALSFMTAPVGCWIREPRFHPRVDYSPAVDTCQCFQVH